MAHTRAQSQVHRWLMEQEVYADPSLTALDHRVLNFTLTKVNWKLPTLEQWYDLESIAAAVKAEPDSIKKSLRRLSGKPESRTDSTTRKQYIERLWTGKKSKTTRLVFSRVSGPDTPKVAQSDTLRGKEDAKTSPISTEQRLRRIEAENTVRYGEDWKDFAFCRDCMQNDGSGLKLTGEKWVAQMGRTIPVYECKTCVNNRDRTNGRQGKLRSNGRDTVGS